MARDVVQRAYDWFGREFGFTRRSGDLFKQSDEVVAVVDLQRSDYDRSYYINVGFGLLQLHDRPVDKFGLCDIRLRAEALMDDGKDLPRLLDLQNELDEDTRDIELRRLLAETFRPTVDAALTVDGLRRLQQSGRLKQGFVRKEARVALSEPEDE